MASLTTPLTRILLAVALLTAAGSAQSVRPGDPNSKTFKKWLDFIRPSESELAYEKIGWRNQLWPAVLEARKLGRPILLWTMNGHPLGCT